MPGAVPGAELALAACLKFSLGPFVCVGSKRGLKARRWSSASSGMLRAAPVFGGAGPLEHREGGGRSYAGGDCGLVCQHPE